MQLGVENIASVRGTRSPRRALVGLAIPKMRGQTAGVSFASALVEESQIAALDAYEIAGMAHQRIHPLLEFRHVKSVQKGLTGLAHRLSPAISLELRVPNPFPDHLLYTLDQ